MRNGSEHGPRTLVLCSHGTRSAAGQRAVRRLTTAVAERLAGAGIGVRPAYVDVQQPHIDDVIRSLDDREDATIVPTLLSTGYHVKTDLTRAAAARPGVDVAPPLGPDGRLTDLLVRGLGETLGREPLAAGDVVILAGAGSSDPEAGRALRAAAIDLAARLKHPVTAGNAAGGRPRVTDLIAQARSGGARRVVVASYLLAPGFFAKRLAAAGADVVAPPFLAAAGPGAVPAELVDLVIDRSGLESSQIIRSSSEISNS